MFASLSYFIVRLSERAVNDRFVQFFVSACSLNSFRMRKHQKTVPDLNFDYDYGASYFCFDVGLVHFIGLNAYAHTAVGSRQ